MLFCGKRVIPRIESGIATGQFKYSGDLRQNFPGVVSISCTDSTTEEHQPTIKEVRPMVRKSIAAYVMDRRSRGIRVAWHTLVESAKLEREAKELQAQSQIRQQPTKRNSIENSIDEHLQWLNSANPRRHKGIAEKIHFLFNDTATQTEEEKFPILVCADYSSTVDSYADKQWQKAVKRRKRDCKDKSEVEHPRLAEKSSEVEHPRTAAEEKRTEEDHPQSAKKRTEEKRACSADKRNRLQSTMFLLSGDWAHSA